MFTANSSQIKTSQPEYFAALDGFRGLLAIFVAIYHTIWISHPQTWRFFEQGPVIIDLFFAFSGFLMWRLYQDRLETSEQAGQFLKRRFARLYPLHLFMLIIFTVFALLRLWAHEIGLANHTPGEILPFQKGAPETWFSFLQHLTLTNSLGLSNSLNFNPPSWTVGAEFCTYLIFMGMMLWCRPRRLTGFVLIALGVSSIYFVLSRIKPDMNITHDYGFWRCVAGFYTGVLASAIFPKFRIWMERVSSGLSSVLEGLTFVAGVLFVIYAPGKAQFLVAPIIFVFVLVFACDKGFISRFMTQRIFQYLAKISYSVYLVHVIVAIIFAIVMERVLGQLPTGWAGDFWLGAYVLVVIAISHLTYHIIEVPGGRFVRNWGRRRKRVAENRSSV